MQLCVALQVKSWNDEKGFGFVIPDNPKPEYGGEDLFVHRKNLAGHRVGSSDGLTAGATCTSARG